VIVYRSGKGGAHHSSSVTLSSYCYRAVMRQEVGVYNGVRGGFDADISIQTDGP